MLQELAARTGATAWVVASMLFFIAVWAWIAVGVFRARSEDMDACARLAIEEDDAAAAGAPSGTGTKG
jgi:cbb3-type cytochrome oxidase subunit 3